MNESVPVAHNMSIISLVSNASGVVQAVLVLLLLFSIVSWVLIFRRGFALRRANQELQGFEKRFWSGVDLNDLYRETPEQPEGAAHIFRAGFREFNRLLPKSKDDGAVLGGVERSMSIALSREEARLGQQLPILASISSSSPYIGLFGTVWGIMGSFQSLSLSQQATLATVAPWIAEALVATAMGLFAAIPAVIAYNRLSSLSEQLMGRYENFAEEFYSILYRNLYTGRVRKENAQG
ncbi:Tol-Pal system protein TolQ [Halomonadaceae bacterium LMG 33818]|uniref:protein TolQ n=1 Tax=Cernens ardua TaxID=3402176 RepID=UPI003EDC4DFE